VRQPLASIALQKITLSDELLVLISDELNVKKVLENTAQEEVVVLDTAITEELKQEGYLREMARAIKDMRKEAGLTASDRAILYVSPNLSNTFVGTITDELQTLCTLQEIQEKTLVEGTSVVVGEYTYMCLIEKVA
jgi:isoleucyl-tRNA synthetase